MYNRSALVLIATLLAGSVLAFTAPRAFAAVTTLNPVADSYVQADLPGSNFGTAAAVKVDGSPVTVSYLKFDVQGLTGAPASATLKVSTAGDGMGLDISRRLLHDEGGELYVHPVDPRWPGWPVSIILVAAREQPDAEPTAVWRAAEVHAIR